MSRKRTSGAPHPFPIVRPEITIKPSRAKPFAVDWREVPGWFGLPEVGDCTHWCTYDPPDWRLTGATCMRGIRPARIHGVECVEIAADGWTMFARATDNAIQWIGNLRIEDGKRCLYTFLDEGFDVDWGEYPRHLEDTGRLVAGAPGEYNLRDADDASRSVFAAGVFRLSIGENRFTCLRVLCVDVPLAEDGVVYVAYVSRQGRAVLGRRYNGRQWGRKPGWPHMEKPPWDEQFPEHDRMVVNGVTYVHWYDCLSDTALGLKP
jgi:hypothetical protein